MSTIDDIERFCGLYLSEEDAQHLVGWIAWRTGRNQALAGAGDALTRLRHVLTHWLDEQQRTQLRDWLARRYERGEPLLPK